MIRITLEANIIGRHGGFESELEQARNKYGNIPVCITVGSAAGYKWDFFRVVEIDGKPYPVETPKEALVKYINSNIEPGHTKDQMLELVDKVSSGAL